MSVPPIVRLDGVSKSYGPVESLRDVSLDIGSNEIVGLIGDNGAGKSTLIKVLTGVEAPTEGDVFIRGRKIDFSSYSVRKARELRIETVHQTSSLGEKQPLWRNFFVGRPITNRFGFIRVAEQKRISEEIMRNTIGFRGAGIDVNTPVSRLSGGERQGVAIGRAMHFDSDLIRARRNPRWQLRLLRSAGKVLNFIRFSIREAGFVRSSSRQHSSTVHEVVRTGIDVCIVRGRLVARHPPLGESCYGRDCIGFLTDLHKRRTVPNAPRVPP